MNTNRETEATMTEEQQELHTEAFQKLLSRRSVLGGLSQGAMVALAGALVAGGSLESAHALGASGGSTQTDIDILNFALNDEYFESELYLRASSGQGLPANLITGGNGDPGTSVTPGNVTGLTGPITFPDTVTTKLFADLAFDESNHVKFIRNTITSLGGTPIARPTLNLAALVQAQAGNTTATITTAQQAIITGRSFCDVGVSAYAGTARFLYNAAVIKGAGRVLAVEAYHAGALRLTATLNNITLPAVDSTDQGHLPPPAGSQYFYVDTTQNAQAIIRTVRQVLGVFFLKPDPSPTATATQLQALAGGFYPNGVNGNLARLLAGTGG